MTTVTRDEVWGMFREIARCFEETDRLIKELRESQKETDSSSISSRT